MLDWFLSARSRNIPVSGPLLQAKALKVAAAIQFEDFKASSGWLNSFRKRHGINFRTLSGESASMDTEKVYNWKCQVGSFLKEDNLADIWNLDETGLFWRGLPDRSLVTKGEVCKGGKLAKERLTVCLLVSAMGEKFKPFVIGKSAMPRAFNKSLPTSVHWQSNKKAWMTSELFRNYLTSFNNAMKSAGRTAILLLDNAPCHPQIELDSVRMIFLPANCTAGTQPLDAGEYLFENVFIVAH
jgi:hypothetical protein